MNSMMEPEQHDNDVDAMSMASNAPVVTSGNRQINILIASSQPQQSAHSKHTTNLFSHSSNPNSNRKTITVMWHNLIYTVERKQLNLSQCFHAGRCSPMTSQKRTILKGITGRFQTGHLTAVMGPSGSGKSTMLECIVGFRKKGLSGNVNVVCDQSDSNVDNLRVALISQTDYLIEVFTVREMLVYASRLKNHDRQMPIDEEQQLTTVVTTVSDGQIDNGNSGSKNTLISPHKSDNYHHQLAVNIIQRLGLDVCADTRAANCSGGQKKRISIGVEMISKPNILILDEPTSGLDSSACFQTVSVMQRLTRDAYCPTGVVCTIHQPSARVFNLFDHIYIISYNGYCIYEGSPQHMLEYLSNVDLVCPQFHNPADFIAEVASGEHGQEQVQRLIEVKERIDLQMPDLIVADRSLSQYSSQINYPTFLHIWILLQRTSKQIIRDPMLNWLRLLSHVTTAIFIGVLYGAEVGEPALCPPTVSPLNDLEQFTQHRTKYQSDLVTTTENLSFIFFTLMFTLFGAMMPIIMTFPANLNVLKKEKTNGWYSLAAYYTALSVAEIPFQICFPTSFAVIGYLMTGQIMSVKRFGLFILINILMAFTAQSQGLLIGGLFMSDASAAVFLGPITTVPIMLFGGFFVRISTIPSYLKIFGYTSYLRYAFELMIMTIYGLDRCQLTPQQLAALNETAEKPEWMGMASMILGEGGEKFLDGFTRSLGGTFDPSLGKKYASSLLDQFDVDENYFYSHFAILLLFIVVLRLLTYFVVSIKINKSD